MVDADGGTRTCPECGAPALDADRFCGECGAALDETSEAGAATALGRSRLGRLRVAAVTLTLAAALAAAVVLGWLVHDWLESELRTTIAVTIDRPVEVVEAEQPAADTMPNVLGLDEETARQVLADAGIEADRVSTKEQPYAGEAGVVIEQEPPPATARGSAEVALTVSSPATVPRLVGTKLVDARDALAQIGATVLVKTRYEPGAAENSVLETKPVAGAALADRVTLVVAEAASSVFLTQLRSITSSCGVETLNVAGRQRADAIVCSPAEDYPAVVEYLLNRRVAAFQAVIGLADRSGNDTPVSFRVFVDGRRAFVQTLSFGSARKLAVPTVGALRIRLEAAVGKLGPSGSQPQPVFAAARFLGGRGAIDNLVAESNQ